MKIPLDTAAGTIFCGLLLTLALFLMVRHLMAS